MFWNKTVYDKKDLDSAFKKCRRKSKSKGVKSAVIFFDLDNMKLVNDQYSHWMGDKVIARYLEILEEHTRDEDALVRFGGDEVILFMPKIVESVVENKIRKIQQACLEDRAFVDLINKGMSVSAGALILEDFGKQTIDSLVDKVSKLTKRAKYTVTHSLVKDLYTFDQEIEINYEKVRRTDAKGTAMRDYYNFMLNDLTRTSGLDAGIVNLCIKDVWREYGLKVIEEHSYEFLKKEILNKYEKAIKMEDVEGYYSNEVA